MVVNPGITVTGQVTVPGITTFTDATVTVQSSSSGDFATAARGAQRLLHAHARSHRARTS